MQRTTIGLAACGDTTTPVDDAFAELVAAFDDPLRCQSRQSLHRCRLGARWLAVPHDDRCGGSVPICTFHKNRWLRCARGVVARCGDVGCPHCRRRFKTTGGIFTFRPL
jgi:hypothetical protein